MADGEETKHCSNCKRDIAAANFVMHEMHCRRHIVLCEHCAEPIPRSELEQHFNDLHAKVPCERCKMQVAKEHMDKHLESDCARKPMMCEYCELSFPKIEYESHQDHCGSRTECCTLCQQYIMLRDLVRHENSGCTFPEPKPAPPPPANDPPDPFRMDDFQFMLDAHNFGSNGPFPQFTTNLRRDLTRNRHTEQSGPPARPTASRTNKPAAANNARRMANNSSRKSDVNVDRARNLMPPDIEADSSSTDWKSAIPPDLDYDTMLALQLAHEDWQELFEKTKYFYYETNTGQDNSKDTETVEHTDNRFNVNTDSERDINIPEHRSNVHTVERGTQNIRPEEEDLCIPCEFCEMEVPLSTYLNHVECCPLGGLSQDNRNNETAATHTHTPAPIPVINNLHAEDNMFSEGHDSPLTRAELDNEVILPCEFCEDMFPAELIIQHQSVCPANGMVTPRATTPATSAAQTRVLRPPPNMTSSLTVGPRSSKPRTQPDPSLLDFVCDNNHVGDNPSSEMRHHDLFHHHQDNSFTFRRVSDSPCDKYSPAMDRFNDAVARPPRRSSRPSTNDDDDHNVMNGFGSEKRPSKSAQRARARLNQLLQEDAPNGSSTQGAGARRSTKPLGQVDKNTSGARSRKTHVTSRTVMNQLDNGVQRPSKNRNEDNPNNPATTSRTRQRSDHVFSPELRLKPDHNRPPPKKR